MNRITNIIRFAVVAVIALGMIAIAFLLFREEKIKSNSENSKSEKLQFQLSLRDYAKYDGRADISGSSVATFLSTHKSDSAAICVQTTKGGFLCVNYAKTVITAKATITSANVKRANKNTKADIAKNVALTNYNSNDEYINPSATFSAEVIYDTDGSSILGIVFTQN